MYPSKTAKEVLSDDKGRNVVTLGKKKELWKKQEYG